MPSAMHASVANGPAAFANGPAAFAERPWHVAGGTGKTRRAERRDSAEWTLVRRRNAKPTWAEVVVPRKARTARSQRRQDALRIQECGVVAKKADRVHNVLRQYDEGLEFIHELADGLGIDVDRGMGGRVIEAYSKRMYKIARAHLRDDRAVIDQFGL